MNIKDETYQQLTLDRRELIETQNWIVELTQYLTSAKFHDDNSVNVNDILTRMYELRVYLSNTLGR